MTQTPATFNLPAAMNQLVPHVFSTMLTLEAAPASAGAPPHGERVCGTVGLGGDTVSGSIYLHLSEGLAGRATAAMLGLDDASAASASDVNDVVGELTNMIGGALKSALCDAERPCAMSPPSIVRGQEFAIEMPPGLRSETFLFDCQGDLFAVEVYLKLN